MAKAIGPSFADELKIAGLLGLPFSWGADGNIQFDARMAPGQIAAVNGVYAAHNPATPALPDPEGKAALLAAVASAASLIDIKAVLQRVVNRLG